MYNSMQAQEKIWMVEITHNYIKQHLLKFRTQLEGQFIWIHQKYQWMNEMSCSEEASNISGPHQTC